MSAVWGMLAGLGGPPRLAAYPRFHEARQDEVLQNPAYRWSFPTCAGLAPTAGVRDGIDEELCYKNTCIRDFWLGFVGNARRRRYHLPIHSRSHCEWKRHDDLLAVLW